jgi:hypothetical protein
MLLAYSGKIGCIRSSLDRLHAADFFRFIFVAASNIVVVVPVEIALAPARLSRKMQMVSTTVLSRPNMTEMQGRHKEPLASGLRFF